jgi:hypothetical protein
MKPLAAIFGLLLLAGSASAQHGQASNGYYPSEYAGDTWTGVVSNVDETTGEFTLTYTKGNKTETFTGVPEEGYVVAPKNGPERPLKPTDIHVGTALTVYYMVSSKKVDGKKVTVNTVFTIKSIPNNRHYATIYRAFSS